MIKNATLYLTLYNIGVNACGTVRPLRQSYSKELISKPTVHNRGYYDYKCNGPLLIAVWVEEQFIIIIFIYYSSGSPGSTFRCSYCKVHLCISIDRKCLKNTTFLWNFGDSFLLFCFCFFSSPELLYLFVSYFVNDIV